MRYICLVINLTCCFVSIAQQRQETYKFVVENKVMVESMSGFYIGANQEHIHTRIIHKDSIIEEVDLFVNGTNTFFKIKNKNWYYKNNKKWSLFFSPKQKISPKIKIGNMIYTLTYKGLVKVGKLDCINYRFENFESDNTTEKNGITTINVSNDTGSGFCFSPKYGFIKRYLMDNVTLIREDILNLKN